MVKYDIVRIELNENKEYNAVFTRMKGDTKKIKVWFNGEKVFDMNTNKDAHEPQSEHKVSDGIKHELHKDYAKGKENER